MKHYGHIDLNQNELQQAVLQVEANFPATPSAGRIVFKGGVVYICVDISEGTPVWIPLTNELQSYAHVQSYSASTWTIVHNLNTTLPSVQIYDSNNRLIYPQSVEVISNIQVNVTFGEALTGRAIVLAGSDTGNTRPQFSYEYTQTSLSNTWVINHNLGYYPVVRVFIGNTEVMPSSITHNSSFTTTITFETPCIGVARLV
jgi:hypothetical protein